MGSIKIFEELIEEKLLQLHTAFLAKVLETDGKTAKIQPLNMIKQKGKDAQKRAPIENVPILQSVKKFKEESYQCPISFDGSSVKKEERKHILINNVEKDDIVFCLCSERNIGEAKNGVVAVPTIGHHAIQDSIIIGVL